jgi:hypothetical protein
MPMLFNNYEELEGDMEWESELVDAFPDPDDSVLELKQREAASLFVEKVAGLEEQMNAMTSEEKNEVLRSLIYGAQLIISSYKNNSQMA